MLKRGRGGWDRGRGERRERERERDPSRSAGTSRGGPGRQTEEW